ncbi:MAG: hypothetical protein ABI779_27200 [Acidobacteriota bacterium]
MPRTDSDRLSAPSLLLVAHPGHELLLSGWVGDVKPFVCVLTDGSGHSSVSRLQLTADFLESAGVPRGPVFGRFNDRELYEAMLSGHVALFESLVEELAAFVSQHRIETVVTDAMEGFNPVHDLCRMLAGAASVLERAPRRYEYPVHAGPHGYDGMADAILRDLDDAQLGQKIAASRAMAQAIPDIGEMLDRFGESAFRRESFRPIDDWAATGWVAGEPPLYEQIGEARIAAGRYDRVIRHTDHFLPLLAALRAMVSPCVS